jgi:hypothetical protein
MKSQVLVLQQQHQHILDQMAKGRSATTKSLPKLPDGVALPLQTFENVTAIERKLLRSPEDKQQMVAIQYHIYYIFKV